MKGLADSDWGTHRVLFFFSREAWILEASISGVSYFSSSESYSDERETGALESYLFYIIQLILNPCSITFIFSSNRAGTITLGDFLADVT